MLQPLTPGVELDEIGYYHFTTGKVAGVDCVISRTGYTGEDGFELYSAPAARGTLWHALIRPGGKVKPVGLGARDSLRLEMALPALRQRHRRQTTPLEAGLGWIVKLDKKGDFVGERGARGAEGQRGSRRKLVGFTLRSGASRGTATRCGRTAASGDGAQRHHESRRSASRSARRTSRPPSARPGTRFEVEIRGEQASRRSSWRAVLEEGTVR